MDTDGNVVKTEQGTGELEMGGIPMAEPFVFHASQLLGERAFPLYASFMACMSLPGDVAECGVFAGQTALELALYMRWRGVDKWLHLFDSFEGFPDIATDEEKKMFDPALPWSNAIPGSFACSEYEVQRFMEGSGNERYKLYPGMFSDTLPQFHKPLCWIHADGDLYRSTIDIIQFADRVLVPGGCMVIDDYDHPRFPGVKRAVVECIGLDQYVFFESLDLRQAFAVKRGNDTEAGALALDRIRRTAMGRIGEVFREMVREVGKELEMVVEVF
jgi:SAM-dependent methyltransferase